MIPYRRSRGVVVKKKTLDFTPLVVEEVLAYSKLPEKPR